MQIFDIRLGLAAMAFAILPATFAGTGKTSTFAFEWRKGMIFVPVRLNGSRPLSFVLDTGSTRNLIDRTLATALGLTRAEKVLCKAPGPPDASPLHSFMT